MANGKSEEKGQVTEERKEGNNIPVKVNAGIKFTLLKNNFVAALQKEDKVLSILLAPTNAPGKNGITIKEMVGEIKELMRAEDNDPEVQDMTNQLENTVSSVGEGGLDPMEIKIFLQQAFLYYRLEKDDSGESVKNLEYAFSLRVDTSKLLKEMDFFNLNEVTLSVWKTERKKVTDSMNMFKIEDFLKEEELPQK